MLSETNLGQRWHFDYRSDHHRELIYQINPDGQRSDSERNDYGRIILRRNPLGRETRYLYDLARRLTNENGNNYQLTYDHNDNLTQETG